jgi:hypothetical protein
LKNKLIDIPTIEGLLPKSFLQLHEVITKIVRDNDILPKKEESKVNSLDPFSALNQKLTSMYNTLVSQNSK